MPANDPTGKRTAHYAFRSAVALAALPLAAAGLGVTGAMTSLRPMRLVTPMANSTCRSHVRRGRLVAEHLVPSSGVALPKRSLRHDGQDVVPLDLVVGSIYCWLSDVTFSLLQVPDAAYGADGISLSGMARAGTCRIICDPLQTI